MSATTRRERKLVIDARPRGPNGPLAGESVQGRPGLRGADEELVRRQTYQPLGYFWALAPARGLARLLQPTRVRPNALTVASGALVVGSAGMVALGMNGPWGRGLVAGGLALALVLDTADGHLARLQGTASEFGRWLDANLDELGDMTLHVAIAWSLFAQSSQPLWLVVGMVYAAGKYLYVVGATTGTALEATSSPLDPHSTPIRADRSFRGACRRLLVLAGHADIRWHLWIVLAAAGRLDLALAAYAAYFPIRTLAGFAQKVARHA